MKTLNLRHVQNLSAQELRQLTSPSPNDVVQLHSLWMGPHLGTGGRTLAGNNDKDAPVLEVMDSIPKSLIQLDLDLTMLSEFEQENDNDVMDEEEMDNLREQALMSSLPLFTNIMKKLLKRLRELQSLSLRCEGPHAVLGLSRALLTMYGLSSRLSPSSSMSITGNDCSQLQVLDFRGNHMGDAGVQALVQALIPSGSSKEYNPSNDGSIVDGWTGGGSWTLPHVNHLILSWNSLTDDAVKELLPLLFETSYQDSLGETKTKASGLKCLDLSCNPGLTNVSLNQHLASALCVRKQRAWGVQSSLEHLVLFSCRQITRLSPQLMHTLCHENFTIQQLNLQGTGCRLSSHQWEKIQFAMHLNSAGRRSVLGPHATAIASPMPQRKARKTGGKKDESTDVKPEVTLGPSKAISSGNLWWTNSVHLSKKRKITPSSNELLNVFLHHNHQQDFSALDLSTIYYFCRETVPRWCETDTEA